MTRGFICIYLHIVINFKSHLCDTRGVHVCVCVCVCEMSNLGAMHECVFMFTTRIICLNNCLLLITLWDNCLIF
jgi:hypothetical protein